MPRRVWRQRQRGARRGNAGSGPRIAGQTLEHSQTAPRTAGVAPPGEAGRSCDARGPIVLACRWVRTGTRDGGEPSCTEEWGSGGFAASYCSHARPDTHLTADVVSGRGRNPPARLGNRRRAHGARPHRRRRARRAAYARHIRSSGSSCSPSKRRDPALREARDLRPLWLPAQGSRLSRRRFHRGAMPGGQGGGSAAESRGTD
jgi:hypothetical protein